MFLHSSFQKDHNGDENIFYAQNPQISQIRADFEKRKKSSAKK